MMLLDTGIQEIRVENTHTGDVIAIISEDEVDTSGDEIVVVVKPKYD